MDNNNLPGKPDLETPAIMALAAASKTPFMTAFKVTLGIGLARFLLFTAGIAILGLVVACVIQLCK